MNLNARWLRAATPGLLGLGLLLLGGWFLHATSSAVATYPVPPPESSSLGTTNSLTPTTFLPIVCNNWLPLDWPYEGASLAGYWHDAYESPTAYAIVDYLHSAGANSVAIITSWYQKTPTSTVISSHPLSTPTDTGLEAIIDYAHSLSLTILLKPHVEIEQPANYWRGEIRPSDLDAWFASFTDFNLHYAQMATDHNVELFCVGTEMKSVTDTDEKRQHWAALVQQVRQVYPGKVIYSAHEYEVLGSHALSSTFWNNFDYAATTVYYSLSAATTPTVDELVQAWSAYGEQLDAWQAGHQKPVIFGEIGYRSLDQCALYPWAWGGLSCAPEIYNGECQANAYEAAFRYLSTKPWLKGVYWWQFEPQGTSDNLGACQCNDYSPACKLAGRVLAARYSGTQPARLCRPMPLPTPPVVDTFEYATDAEAQNVWQAQSSSIVTVTMDASTHAPVAGSTRSMEIASHIPCAQPRFIQLRYTFCSTQNWSLSKSLELWVKGDGQNQAPLAGEFSIVLVDQGSKDPEIWQSSRQLDRRSGWTQLRLSLSGQCQGNPWEHPTDFAIPPWESRRNGVLDINAIKEIWIKALTSQSDCAAEPDFHVWVDNIVLSTDPVDLWGYLPSALPTVDAFNYSTDAEARNIWRVQGTGTAVLTADSQVFAPVSGNSRSMKIRSQVPCASPRWIQLEARFCGPQDWRTYGSLEIWVKVDTSLAPDNGGEFSIVLIDKGSSQREVWQATKWLDRNFNEYITIPLIGYGKKDPFTHQGQFVIPPWEWGNAQNEVLDLNAITEVWIKALSGQDQCSQHPDFAVWVDEMKLK
jgi:hypothetical protein